MAVGNSTKMENVGVSLMTLRIQTVSPRATRMKTATPR